jgi:glyoxylate/hydroxypyruvate reductase A
MSVLYRADRVRGQVWAQIFAERAPDLDFRMWPDAGDLDAVEYLIAWQPPADLLRRLPNLKVLISFGAGIDHLDLSVVPEHVPVVRMVEPGLVDGMVEYVTMSVLAIHRNLIDYMREQSRGTWRVLDVVPAGTRSVGVMGLGVLGKAVLQGLGAFGYRRYGWSRRLGQIPGVTCYAGGDSLQEFLGHCDILVCLLPLTAETRGILDRRLMSGLPRGAWLINVGRGAHLDEQALLEALEAGQLSGAILDVFETEPLPEFHPFWQHPRIVVTPHIAAETQPHTAAPIVLENIRRHQRGEPLRDLIDRRRGY